MKPPKLNSKDFKCPLEYKDDFMGNSKFEIVLRAIKDQTSHNAYHKPSEIRHAPVTLKYEIQDAIHEFLWNGRGRYRVR